MVTININKGLLIFVGAFVLSFIVLSFGVAQWDSSKSMFHSAEDVKVTISGIDYSLQEAINEGLIGEGSVKGSFTRPYLSDVTNGFSEWITPILPQGKKIESAQVLYVGSVWPVPDAFTINTWGYVRSEIEFNSDRTQFRVRFISSNEETYLNYPSDWKTLYVSVDYS